MADQFPQDLRYTESDEWIRTDGDIVIIGVTAFAAEQLGDVVYLQPPEVGAHFDKDQPFGEIESVKAVSELNSPLTGEVTEVNRDLDQNPALVNEDPFGAGWMVKMRPENKSEMNTLLDAQSYRKNTEERG